ncbi:hypothetical protein TNCV_4420361 [Trichonephila clavipes]|nr:hypothetical protein TNCV_4420361 [Trichonephila clavipes]
MLEQLRVTARQKAYSMQGGENTHKPMNLKPTYVINLLRMKLCAVMGHGISTRTKSNLSAGCGFCLNSQSYSISGRAEHLFNGMREAGRSARQVSRQLGGSDCVVRRCWGQWT